MIRDVVFRPWSNDFQSKLRNDCNKILASPDVLVAADKTTNYYEVKVEDYNDLLQTNIQAEYRKAAVGEIAADINEQKELVNKLDIEDRVMYTPPQPAYVTLKDHKTNFNNDPKCRLINPTKNEISKVSKQILSKVVNEVRSKTHLKLMKNTNSVINWFEELMLKQDLVFIQFDIVDYYGSISEKLFDEALQWAKSVTSVSDDEIEVIMKSKVSLLSDAKDLWKKTKNGKFNIAMGSWDGAEATDICGLFLLSKLRHLNADFVLYRDDGLAVSRLNPKQVEDMKKELHRIFKRYGLSITTDVNHKIVNFLDVTLNLNDGTVTPHKKENNTIMYVNKHSNHAPSHLNAIPQGVQSRLTRNSTNEEIFKEAVKP